MEIVVAPTQTLTNKEYQMLRTASLKIIRALGIEVKGMGKPLSDMLKSDWKTVTF